MPENLPLIISDASVGLTLAVCGAIAWHRRPGSRVGAIMLVASGCWFAGSLLGPAVYLHRGPLVHLHISYPTGRLRRPLAVVTVVAAYTAAGLEAISRNPWLTLGLAFLVSLAAFDVFIRTAGPARKAAQPALGSALAFGAMLAVSSANQLLLWDADVVIAYAYNAVVASLVVVLLVNLLRGGWTDATLSDLVTSLGERSGRQGIRGELQQALGDPSVQVGYWVPEQGCYVDESGRPLEVAASAPGRAMTRIDDHGRPAAILVHDEVVLSDPRLMAGVTSAARLAVANARMNAEVQARVAELAASRRRIVEASDAQRRRLTAELSRGPEHHLEEIARALRARQDDGETSQELTRFLEELADARKDLREFAQGIRPQALTTGGLDAALPLLAARSTMPVQLAVDVGRLEPAVEAAVYFVCSEALANTAKHAHATKAGIDVWFADGSVHATVADDGVGGADSRGSGLRGLSDRVEALGGTIAVSEAQGGGTVVAASIPVATPEEAR